MADIVISRKNEERDEVVIRYPTDGDAQAMCDYINNLSKEQTFVRFRGEVQSLEDETKYLEGQLKRITEKRTVQLLLFVGDKLVGISGIDLKDKTEKHEGVFGISVEDEHRGQGLGKKLMQTTLDEAVANLSDLRIVTLGVFGGNKLALEMYEKFGFKEYGRLPEGVFRKGEYDDHIYMYKKVR